MDLGVFYLKFCVINLVFITSNGQDINPAIHAAVAPPSDALATGLTPLEFNYFLNI